MYNNPYINQQNFNDRIDNEIERLKQMKSQIKITNHQVKKQIHQLELI